MATPCSPPPSPPSNRTPITVRSPLLMLTYERHSEPKSLPSPPPIPAKKFPKSTTYSLPNHTFQFYDSPTPMRPYSPTLPPRNSINRRKATQLNPSYEPRLHPQRRPSSQMGKSDKCQCCVYTCCWLFLVIVTNLLTVSLLWGCGLLQHPVGQLKLCSAKITQLPASMQPLISLSQKVRFKLSRFFEKWYSITFEKCYSIAFLRPLNCSIKPFYHQ